MNVTALCNYILIISNVEISSSFFKLNLKYIYIYINFSRNKIHLDFLKKWCNVPF